MLLLLALLACLVPQQAAGNELKSSSNYKMQTYNDHLYFDLLIADLKGVDDWVTDGKVKAYSQDGRNGVCITLFNVWTVNQSNTEYHRVYGKIEQNGALAKLVGTYSSGMDHLRNGDDLTYVKIEDDDHNFPKMQIDFYWAPVMGGRTWYIYFEGKADNGDDLTYRLGRAECPDRLGRPSIDVTSFTCTRKNSQQLEFSIPGTPNGSACPDYQQHEGWYDVTFIYHLYSGQTKQEQKTFTCEPGQRTAHVVDIPASVGNFRRLDLVVKPTDAYKNTVTNTYYYKDNQRTYKPEKVLPTVPTPNNVVAEYRQFDSKTELKWNAYVADGTTIYTYYKESVPYIYRIETDAAGNALSGQSWKKLGTLKQVQDNKTYTYSDNSGVKPNSYYKYIVANVPKAWTESKANDIAEADLNSPDDDFMDILHRVGYVETPVVSTKQVVSIFDFKQDPDVTDKVKLLWKYTRVPGVNGNVTFDVFRSPKDANKWNKIGTATSKANPDANTVATFEDSDLSNENVRYDYKVQLTLGTAGPFNSDVITAGLLKGTSLNSFTASKGTHDSSVMLRWTAHHVGTDNTNYDIYRRYVDGTSDDWMLITSVSGRSDSYTFEDKTVRPGYYYEYKIEKYSGEKTVESTPVSQLPTAIGFCQARGVVSGRISFATGNMGVEDVRVTLSSDDDDNTVQNYSQRVDGASTGIQWQADSTELAKVFGPDKDFTVQMFVRPDSLLSEGAVIGEIPGEGRIVLGSMSDGEYNLALQKVTGYVRPPTISQTPLPDSNKTTNLSTLTGDYRALNGEILTGTLGGNYKISIADGAVVFLKDVIINGTHDWSYKWAGINSPGDATLVLEGNNTVKGFYYDYPGIHIAEGKTLTIKGTGSLTASSNGYGAGIGGGDEISCGNIVIEGGTITAHGGDYGAGIGSGLRGSCGSITITYVEKLTASAGSNARTIGNGYKGTCGTVTIGETVYPDGISQSPYTLDSKDISGFRYGTATNTNVAIPSSKYSLLTVSRTGDNLQFQVDGGEAKTLTANKFNHLAPFSVGGADGIIEAQAFKGNLAEVRVWNHALTEKEKTSYNDRVLSGRESGLALYWPMDEGLDRYAFDASYSNDVPNGRHATMGTNVSRSVIFPDKEQLSRYGVTNASGEYTIRGIPFVGSGTAYTFTPSKGIHTFTPASRNGFISPSSLALNGTDFNDESSFPLSGKVTYLNTNIPVDSVQFKIDGTLAQNQDGLLVSDANGEYEISVPIGQHRIEAWKDGHRLTSLPLEEGRKYDFAQAEVCNFVDSTLVNVTGRINGGFSDKDQPVGFGLSTNRIGRATLKLSLGRESQSSFNYITDEHGDGRFGTTALTVASATNRIASKAYRGAGTESDNTETHYIYIKTDSLTGEFSALLPPLKYKVESISFYGDEKGDKAHYNNLDFFTQNLPMIDATITNEKEMPCDSLVGDGGAKENYYYSAKMVRQLRTEPILTVTQDDMQNGAFGMDSLLVENIGSESEKVEVTKYQGDGFKYNFDYPLFLQNETYNMTISLAEQYTNVDTKETVTEIPADATIHISNEGSISTAVIAEKCILDDKEMQPGEVYAVNTIEATPDEQGQVKYSWIAGLPNLAGEHLRSLTISAKVDNRTTMWKPDGKTNNLNFVSLGGIITGTNFVTVGPDRVDMILRRPPGSTAYATWTVDTIHSDYNCTATYDGHSGGGGLYVSVGPNVKTSLGTVSFWKQTEIAVIGDHKVTRANITEDTDLLKDANSYTISEAKTTPTGNTYTQRDGDTFIGRSTNLLFGKGEAINLFKQPDNTYKIDQKETVCTGETFTTTFIYPHQYIEDVLIPNWQTIIDSYLTHWDGDLKAAPRVNGKMMYYTNYSKGDPEWGKANGDTDFWTMEQIRGADYMPSYRIVNGLEGEAHDNAIDSVEWAANQIKRWKYWLAENEKDKVDAFISSSCFDKNYSIAGGTSVNHTSKNSREHTKGNTAKVAYSVNNETRAGVLFNNLGAYGIIQFEDHWGETTDSGSIDETTESFTWQISDAEPTTALSVDVYESPNKWGPIFRTRGGQSSQPYEGATYTKYFQPGTQLDEGTMRVEKPELRVDGATTVTDVPTGGQAKFNLQLYNASETNSVCTYNLKVLDGSNPNGARLTIDGSPLSNGGTGRTVRMKGGELISKQLIVMQSDRAIRDYENIQLVLTSTNDTTTLSDPVVLSAHFVPASALVDMVVDNTVLNEELLQKNNGVIVSLRNLDPQDEGLAGLRVRYRRKGTSSWTLAKEWSVDEVKEKLSESPNKQITTAVAFPEDGLYELHAQTFGMYGNEEVTYETDNVEVTQDTRGPKMLGMVSPENGQLNWLNRNNMHIRFNEELNSVGLSKSDNFRIEGGMNNMVADKGRSYPDVALQLNRDSVETDAMYDLGGSSFALDLWLYRQGDGKIISVGTKNNQLSLSTHDGGLVSVCIGNEDNTMDAIKQLPENKWLYMALAYKQKTDDNTKGELTMLYATADDANVTYIFKDEEVDAPGFHGKLSVGGSGMQGMMARVSLWNSDITAESLYESRTKLRAPYTPGLVGYWKMDEGHGTQLADIARSRHIQMPAESWYINNRNLAAHLDGEEGSALKINVSTLTASSTDNFAYEMWFRGTEAGNVNAALMSTDNAAGGKTVIGFDNGKLALKVSDSSTTLSNQNYLDGNWHHVALNVRRGTSAIAYVDGNALKVLPESTIPGIASAFITVGAELSGYTEQNRFTGDVDEIRIWEAALDGQLIGDRMYERMDESYPGLEGYFPMENVNRNQQGTVTTFFTLKNYGDTKSRLKLIYGKLDDKGRGIDVENADTTQAFRQAIYEKVQATNAPGLKVGSSKMRMDDSQFDFTASGDEIYLSFPDGSLPLMDGNDFVATVSSIKDEHGNTSEPVSWKFHCDFAALAWNIGEETLSKPWNEPMEWRVYIANRTGTAQSYELSGLPTWMTVDKQIGTIGSDGGLVTFRMSTGVPVGRHTEYIYLTDQLGIRRVLRLNLTVTGNVPDWTVDPDLYESNMTMTGQIYIDGKICENTDTRIAAFDELGLCRGVASPKYVATRDAYYVDMVIYGASATELSTGVRNLEFKVYDASKGTISPLVGTILPGNTEAFEFQYVPDANFGSYDAPVVFDVREALEQQISLAKGWTWMSLYVDPLFPNLEFVLPKDVNIRKRFKNIKSKTAFATVDKNGDINGLLETLEPGQMYKMQLTTKTDYPLVGLVIDVKNTPQTMYPGYNWIGTLSSSVMSVDDAFADLQPETGDRVKSRTAFAEFSNKGYWEGTLESIVPGQGYIYRSQATEAKTFHYPDKTATQRAARRAEGSSQPTHFTPVDPYLYPDNLSIIAVVKKDGQERDDAELGAFIDDECRGAIAFRKGYYFLTVMGSSQDDSQKKMELRVYVDGEEYMVDDTLPFISDAFYGSLDEPYVLDINASAIREISSSADDNDDDWWTLQGFKIGRKPTQPGVYIHHGKKVTIKRVK